MYSFGKTSTEKLITCRNELQIIAKEAIKLVDFSILVGYRNEADQTAAYNQGASQTQWPNSKHNTNPSDAFDFAPYYPNKKIDWKDTAGFTYIAGILIGIGLEKGIILRWGGDWKQNGKLKENGFDDLGHIEFVRMLEK